LTTYAYYIKLLTEDSAYEKGSYKLEGNSMSKVYTAVTKRDDDWGIGGIEEVPGVNCQERTHKELLESLKVTLREALEFNRQDAISAVGADFQEEQIAI